MGKNAEQCVGSEIVSPSRMLAVMILYLVKEDWLA